MEFKLSWNRSCDVPYPKTWITFKAKDLDGDNVVEYRICDLPENRFEDLCDVMENDFLVNEPKSSTLETKNDPESVKIWRSTCEAAYKQKLINVCMKDGSDEICGFNLLYVSSKADNVNEQVRKMYTTKAMSKMRNTFAPLYTDFDVFEHYNVDRFLASFALCVVKKYGQRGIGQKLMEVRKLVGLAHNLEITHSTFSSVYSNKLADRCGYELNREIRCDEWRALNPDAAFNDTFTCKTWVLK